MSTVRLTNLRQHQNKQLNEWICLTHPKQLKRLTMPSHSRKLHYNKVGVATYSAGGCDTARPVHSHTLDSWRTPPRPTPDEKVERCVNASTLSKLTAQSWMHLSDMHQNSATVESSAPSSSPNSLLCYISYSNATPATLSYLQFQSYSCHTTCERSTTHAILTYRGDGNAFPRFRLIIR